jgi:hypothetical protein
MTLQCPQATDRYGGWDTLFMTLDELAQAKGRTCPPNSLRDRDENGTEIFRTESHRFLHLIRSNSYFWTNSNLVRNSEHEIRN